MAQRGSSGVGNDVQLDPTFIRRDYGLGTLGRQPARDDFFRGRLAQMNTARLRAVPISIGGGAILGGVRTLTRSAPPTGTVRVGPRGRA